MSIDAIDNSQLVGGVTPSTTGTENNVKTKETTPKDGSFDSVMAKLLRADGEKNVNEEELFAQLVHERLAKRKGEEIATKYSETLAKKEDALRRPDGRTYTEDAAVASLRKLQKDGDISEEEMGEIYNESFDAAQLDNNTNKLFDSIGGKGDPTRAVATMESALTKAKLMIDEFDSGAKALSTREVPSEPMDKNRSGGSGLLTSDIVAGAGGPIASDITPNGNVLDGAEGLLWKPESDSDGKVAFLPPSSLTGGISSVIIKNAEEKVLDSLRYSGVGNGNRETWRGGKQGGDYGDNLTVEIMKKNGEIVKIHIPDGSTRYD